MSKAINSASAKIEFSLPVINTITESNGRNYLALAYSYEAKEDNYADFVWLDEPTEGVVILARLRYNDGEEKTSFTSADSGIATKPSSLWADEQQRAFTVTPEDGLNVKFSCATYITNDGVNQTAVNIVFPVPQYTETGSNTFYIAYDCIKKEFICTQDVNAYHTKIIAMVAYEAGETQVLIRHIVILNSGVDFRGGYLKTLDSFNEMNLLTVSGDYQFDALPIGLTVVRSYNEATPPVPIVTPDNNTYSGVVTHKEHPNGIFASQIVYASVYSSSNMFNGTRVYARVRNYKAAITDAGGALNTSIKDSAWSDWQPIANNEYPWVHTFYNGVRESSPSILSLNEGTKELKYLTDYNGIPASFERSDPSNPGTKYKVLEVVCVGASGGNGGFHSNAFVSDTSRQHFGAWGGAGGVHIFRCPIYPTNKIYYFVGYGGRGGAATHDKSTGGILVMFQSKDAQTGNAGAGGAGGPTGIVITDSSDNILLVAGACGGPGGAGGALGQDAPGGYMSGAFVEGTQVINLGTAGKQINMQGPGNAFVSVAPFPGWENQSLANNGVSYKITPQGSTATYTKGDFTADAYSKIAPQNFVDTVRSLVLHIALGLVPVSAASDGAGGFAYSKSSNILSLSSTGYQPPSAIQRNKAAPPVLFAPGAMGKSGRLSIYGVEAP
jgi:hypothetical protein